MPSRPPRYAFPVILVFVAIAFLVPCMQAIFSKSLDERRASMSLFFAISFVAIAILFFFKDWLERKSGCS